MRTRNGDDEGGCLKLADAVRRGSPPKNLVSPPIRLHAGIGLDESILRLLESHKQCNSESLTSDRKTPIHNVAIIACQINGTGLVSATTTFSSAMPTLLLDTYCRRSLTPSKFYAYSNLQTRNRHCKERTKHRCRHCFVSHDILVSKKGSSY